MVSSWKPKKSTMFKREVVFLGRVITGEGYNLDPKTVDPILSLKDTPPQTVNEAHKLMGFLNYNCWYIAFTIVKIRQNDSTAGKGKSSQGKQVANHPVWWTPEHQSVLEELINFLVSAPIMAYPDHHKPYVLRTDSSEIGLGCSTVPRTGWYPMFYCLRFTDLTRINHHLHSGKLHL